MNISKYIGAGILTTVALAAAWNFKDNPTEKIASNEQAIVSNTQDELSQKYCEALVKASNSDDYSQCSPQNTEFQITPFIN